ncbi:MAG: hypothetical protein AB9M53_02435 [Leptothrix sp. (in: b-proteobacteria)]
MDDIPRIGDQIVWNGKRWSIFQLRLQHAKISIEGEDGDATVLGVDDFRSKVATGEIQRVVRERNGTEHVVVPGWQQVESERACQERQQRRAILDLEAGCLAQGMTFRKAHQEIVRMCEQQGWVVRSERTLRNWRPRANGHESMLSPQWQNSGNRRQGPDEILLAAMSDVMEQAVLSSDRFDKSSAWKLVLAVYHSRCAESNVIPRPASIRQFNRLLKRVSWIQQMKDRLNPGTYRALTRVAVKPHTADHLWELVEIDASFLDVFVRNERHENIGRPVLYIAIDVASGYVVGFELTIQKPSVLGFLDCMRFMYFPKADLDERYQIRQRIELFGKPVRLKVDNGSEFVGKHATELVRNFFGDRAQCKPYTPEEKPHVERFFGTVRKYVKSLPGSIVSSVTTTRRDLSKSELRSLLTLDELKGRLLRFIYDEYALEMNEGRSWRWRESLGPLDIVKNLKKHQIEPFPVNREEFERAVYFKSTTRRLGHEGIEFDGFNYHSDELAKLYRTHGAGSYTVHYSEVSATEIFVFPPDGGPPVQATAKQLHGEQVDRARAKVIAKEIKAGGKMMDQRAVQARLRQFEEAVQDAKSVTSRNKQARIADSLKRAREALRPSMRPALGPQDEGHGPCAAPVNPGPEFGSQAERTFGRTRGARRP